jgi:hypothetical protein
MRWPSIRNLMLTASLTALAASSFGGVFVSVSIAPPVLPVYTQPICPGPDYIWTPGYWAYGTEYYWVPGTWVLAPQPGFLWTPGYWGPHVGFYGGVNYGFGYGGVGFAGGAWVGGHFSYNTAVANVNTAVIHNTYVNRTVINNTVVNRTSFNGPGGITARPNAVEMAAAREQHVAATSVQASHERAAGVDRSNFASVNHGRPANMAMARPMAERNQNDAPAGHANAPANHTPSHANNLRVVSPTNR